jgi:murein tripeptide amidase MpaA
VVNDGHLASLLEMGVSYDILIDDVEHHLNEGHRDLQQSRANMDEGAMLADFFTAYHTYDEYVAYLRNLTTVYSSISKFIPSVGTTIQGRAIFGLTITGTATGTKKKIFISGGQHAREWIAPATVTYIITQLITRYGTDTAVTSLLNSAIIHFVPMVNPDGYTYTWGGTSQRLWRKNRRMNTGGSYGVDLNRNWNDHWGGEGSSGTPTSDTYRGTAPFSEPESKAVADYVTANGPFVGAIDYHSYSQLILRPYGWTNALPPNDAQAKTIGDTIRARILSVNNVAYTSQASWQLYYTTGSAQDWYYGQAKVPISYTIELRDTGAYGFQLPANQIKPTGAENWAGFLYFAQVV